MLLVLGCTNNPYPRADANRRILYRPFVEAPKTLDPSVAYTTTAHQINGLVNATLLEYDYLARPYQLISGLAREVPQPERVGEGIRYGFELLPDLLYQDDPCFGTDRPRRLVARDVAFSLMRIADPEVNSPAAQPFSHVAGFADFRQRLTRLRETEAGFRQLGIREQYDRAGGMAGALARSPTRFELTLAEPYPQILYWFTMPFMAPIPFEAVDYYDGQDGRDHLADHPVGAGPYRLETYDKQSRIVLVRNENWHGLRHPEWKAPGTVFPTRIPEAVGNQVAPGSAGRPLAQVERIELRREKEAIPSFTKFLQGYYDLSGIVRESFDRVVQNDRLSPDMVARGMSLSKTVEPAIYYLGFNMDDATVGKPGGDRSRKLRQAMSIMVDADEFLRLFTNGRGIPAQSILPPGIFGYEADYVNPMRQLDLNRAQRLLAEAGYEGGVDPKTGRPLRITFDTGSTGAQQRLTYTFFINGWRKLGIDVELQATNYNKFQQKMREGNFQIFLWGWVADYPDPENFYFLGWSQMGRKRSNGPNSTNFSDPRYDELFLQMKTMENGPARLAIIRELREILERECPRIPLYHPEQYALHHGWLGDVVPMGLSVPNDKYYALDAEQRTRERRAWNRPVVWPALLLAALLLGLITPGVLTFYRERQ